MISCNPTRSISVFVINGTADLLVPYSGATFTNNGWPLTYFPTDTLMNFWALKNGCYTVPISQNLPNTNLTDNSTITKFEYNNCNCGVQTILYRVNGGGHTWPGVENLFYELIAGETNEDIHASAAIWNFFKNKSLNCLTTEITDEFETNKYIHAFPNPVENMLTISSKTNFPTKLFVADILGRVVWSKIVKGEEINPIDFESQPSGIYFLGGGDKWIKILKIERR